MASVYTTFRPEESWLPLEPTEKSPFNRRRAAHLFRRAGFAANSRELDAAVKSGLAGTVQRLLSAPADSSNFDAEMHRVAATVIATNNPEPLAGWWLYRMRHTPAPLLEKLTLFWHGHFATSAAKVKDPQLIYSQNQLLRRHALGKFGELVAGISRDPAMLLYLDSATNRKTHPNENFAREVMELFCLGVGRYTERDIQQLARCFTGWEIQHGEFKFNQFQHDYAAKTVLGNTGNFDGDEGLQIILEQPATAEFLCRKLVKFFVSDEADPPPEYIAPLAAQFRESGLTIAPVVETIFLSRLFHSDAAIGSKIRSPVELAAGLLRSLEATANMQELAGALRELDQMLFFPPNVKGWNGGRSWINSSTLLGRANLVRQLVESPNTRFGGSTLDDYLSRSGAQSSADQVDWLCELLIAPPLSQDVRAQLKSHLVHAPKRPEALKQLLHLLGSLPEFQLA